MNITNYKTFLPVFPGFYGTVWDTLTDFDLEDTDNEKTEEKREKELDRILDNYDYDAAHVEIAQLCVDAFNQKEDLKQAFPFVFKWTFEKLYSPKEYNYINDSIDVTVEVDQELLGKMYNEAKKTQEFKKYLQENFTSYSGFLSFWDNFPESEDWRKITEDNIGFIFEFFIKQKDFENLEFILFDFVSSSFSKWDFVE